MEPNYRDLHQAQIIVAIGHLRDARDHLIRAKAPRATAKVRSAIKSAEGALRHSQTREYPT